MRNRIRVLENTDCIFLLDKEKGEYWAEVKRNLDSCPSQQEYNRLLQDNPTLADRAIYNPQSAFVDLLDDNRTEIDEQVGSPLERDRQELTFLNKLSREHALIRYCSNNISCCGLGGKWCSPSRTFESTSTCGGP
ncbi:hypothetical protein AHAS_Ahas03G0238700 [Arachis hypogaea]